MPQDVPSPVTREALYEAVWTTAMHVLAPRFGYTDRGLAKLCQREGIPVPPRGYWAKVRAGHRVRRPPLPAAPVSARQGAAADLPVLVERPPAAQEPEDRPPFSPEIAALQMKLQGLPPIAVREHLRGHHEFVPTGTQSSTASERRPWTDARYAPGLSAALDHRARCILDALARRTEALGVKVESQSHRGIAFTGTLLGVPFTVFVYEPLRRVKPPPRKNDIWRRDWEYDHSGRLAVGVQFGWYPDRVWNAKPDRVAERLDEILPLVLQHLDDDLRARADREREEREEEERERRRAAAEAAREQERARRRHLFVESARWQQVTAARSYVEAVEAELVRRDGGIRAGSEAEQWLAWARGVVDRRDPVRARVPAAP